jgi:hypothetical protein
MCYPVMGSHFTKMFLWYSLLANLLFLSLLLFLSNCAYTMMLYIEAESDSTVISS